MSYLFDTNPQGLAGAYHFGGPGLGVLGSVIRATTASGTHGPGYLYNDWDGSGDDAQAFQGLVITPPSAGVFVAWEDGSFSLTGAADGSYSFTYRLYVDGADQGTATAIITLGVANATASGSVAAVQLTAPEGSAEATGPASATASGSVAAVSITAPTGSATGSFAGDASASGALAALLIVPPDAMASATANATAEGAVRAVSLVAPSAYAFGGGTSAPVPASRTRVVPVAATSYISPARARLRTVPTQ